MGMDLCPLNDKVESFHANWAGWSILGDLLLELGVNVSLMAGSNDGDLVPSEVAQDWGTAIVSNASRIRVVVYPDESFFGGERVEFRVDGSQTPVLMSSFEASRAWVDRSLGRVPASDKEPAPPVVFSLEERPDDAHWVLSFARFCLNSGGFRQF